MRTVAFSVLIALSPVLASSANSQTTDAAKSAMSITPARPTGGTGVRIVPRGSEKPSFDCAKAKTAAARLICSDRELAQLDGELGVAFQKRKAQTAVSDQGRFVEDQFAWIKDRNTRCELDAKNNATIEALAGSKSCMVGLIKERIAFLTQTTTTAPNISKARQGMPYEAAKQTGREWMQSAPAFCQTSSYGSLTQMERAACDEVAFRQLSNNWQTLNAANGQAYEVALDTIVRNLPASVAPPAELRAATVVVYVSEGAIFNPDNVVHFYFDCHDRFQTFQSQWSPVAYAPPLSVAAKIASVACGQIAAEVATRPHPMLPGDNVNSQWLEIRNATGETKATIDVSSIIHDADGNAHARVCLNVDNVVCPASGYTLRWFFNCHNHEYSAIDTSVLPQLPHEMSYAQSGSVADKLSVIACR